METSAGMTRYSVKKLLETIFRRPYWLLIFAVVCAFGFSLYYWYQFHATHRVSATFIPAIQAAEESPAVGPGGYSVVVAQSFIKHEQVLDAVIKSVDFDITYGELSNAISAEANENGVAVTVHVEWREHKQAQEILEALKANLSFAITHSAKAGTIKWLDSASEVSGRSDPGAAQAYIIFMAGAVIGIIIGALLSLLLSMFDKRVFDLDAVRYNGDVRVIGLIGKENDKLKAQSGSVSQQLTAIALYLKKLADTNGSKLVMCLSPTRKCGTSTVVAKISKVLAGMRMNVLIVTINSGVSKQIYQGESAVTPLSPGVDRCAFNWDDKESNPDFAGPISTMLSAAEKKYALILVDCPALLENIQMTEFAGGMDTTLLVCGYGVTRLQDLSAAVALLTRAEAKPIYCVWNFVSEQYQNTFLPVEATTDQRKGTDEQPKGLGADVHL